jgi:hypothetical protein
MENNTTPETTEVVEEGINVLIPLIVVGLSLTAMWAGTRRAMRAIRNEKSYLENQAAFAAWQQTLDTTATDK